MPAKNKKTSKLESTCVGYDASVEVKATRKELERIMAKHKGKSDVFWELIDIRTMLQKIEDNLDERGQITKKEKEKEKIATFNRMLEVIKACKGKSSIICSVYVEK